jgi:4-hydroxybenzoate polyprenyltransferase
MLSRTVAHATDGRNRQLILLAGILGCVINGDTMSAILRQATWLVVAVIVLIAIQILDDWLDRRLDGTVRLLPYPYSSGVQQPG